MRKHKDRGIRHPVVSGWWWMRLHDGRLLVPPVEVRVPSFPFGSEYRNQPSSDWLAIPSHKHLIVGGQRVLWIGPIDMPEEKVESHSEMSAKEKYALPRADLVPQIHVRVPCPDCKGSGIGRLPVTICYTCAGTGYAKRWVNASEFVAQYTDPLNMLSGLDKVRDWWRKRGVSL